jgi:translation initiation factor 3 subunit M
MAANTNTLLIEGSFAELADEFAQYIDSLRKNAAEGPQLQPEVAALLQEDKKDEALKKLVGAATILNTAPEKGPLQSLMDFK